jgi:hypothetical protein
MNYLQDRIEYYKEKLRESEFFDCRNSADSDIHTSYLINQKDWRLTVIITGSVSNCFRINFLYVNQENSFYFSENDFDTMKTMITEDLKKDLGVSLK